MSRGTVFFLSFVQGLHKSCSKGIEPFEQLLCRICHVRASGEHGNCGCLFRITASAESLVELYGGGYDGVLVGELSELCAEEARLCGEDVEVVDLA